MNSDVYGSALRRAAYATLWPEFWRPIFARVTLPEGRASIRVVESVANGARCVCLMIDRGTRLPGIDLHIDPNAAQDLVRQLTECADNGRPSDG